MPSYYLHTDNARQALEAIANGLSCIRLSTDLNLSERDFPLSDQCLVLDEDNRLSIDELKRIVKKTPVALATTSELIALATTVLLIESCQQRCC